MQSTRNDRPLSIDVRVQIAIMAVYSVCIFFADTWEGLLAFFLMGVLFCIALRPPIAKMLKLGTVVYVIAASTLFFNSFMFTPDGIAFTVEGFQRGCFFAARIILLVMVSLILCLTCDALAISQAIRSFLSVFSRFGLPADDIAMIISIALRFIPLTASEYFTIKDAQWSRGASFDEGKIFKRVKAHCAILIPLFINMFRKADALAMSMDARGYGISTVRRVDINSRRCDVFSIAVGIAISAACILLAILY